MAIDEFWSMANEFSLGLWLQVGTVGKRMKGVVPEELKGRVEADVIKKQGTTGS